MVCRALVQKDGEVDFTGRLTVAGEQGGFAAVLHPVVDDVKVKEAVPHEAFAQNARVAAIAHDARQVLIAQAAEVTPHGSLFFLPALLNRRHGGEIGRLQFRLNALPFQQEPPTPFGAEGIVARQR